MSRGRPSTGLVVAVVVGAPVAGYVLWHLHRAGRETAWFFHGLDQPAARAGGAILEPESEPVPPVTTPRMFVRASIRWN